MNTKQIREQLLRRLSETTLLRFWGATPEDNKHFNMQAFNFDCGSPACVAAHLKDLAPDKWQENKYPEQNLKIILEIKPEDAANIFHAKDELKSNPYRALNSICPGETIQKLKKIFKKNPILSN